MHRSVFAFTVLVAACGSPDAGEPVSAPDAAPVDATGADAEPEAHPDAPPPDATDEPTEPEAAVPCLYYPDGDGDGFGARYAMPACEPGPGLVLDGTDCADDDNAARPTQDEPQTWHIVGARDVAPFDFDCDGTETPAPAAGPGWSTPPAPGCGNSGTWGDGSTRYWPCL